MEGLGDDGLHDLVAGGGGVAAVGGEVGENGACPPTKSGSIGPLLSRNQLEIGLKNGAYPFTISP